MTTRPGSELRLEPMQWVVALAIGLICLALIGLIWTLTARAAADQTGEIQSRAELQAKALVTVLALDIQHDMQLVDQSVAIVQDAWQKDSDNVDLAAWRKQLLALAAVADDIFIANERRIIVQGTLPKSIGQAFGSAYVTVPNGSLETFDRDGSKNFDGRISVDTLTDGHIEARQSLMYILRPLDRPRGWFAGASYRSADLTRLFAAADLGQNGVVALIETRRGVVQAIAGPAARAGSLNIAQSELVDAMRKNEAGIWSGKTPIDGVARIIAYQRIEGRDMTVMVGIGTQAAMQPVYGLITWARGLAALGSLIVLTIGSLVLWTIGAANRTKRRQRALERAELNLANVSHELLMARARVVLTEPEVGTLISSTSDGVARLDEGLRLRQWNHRFAELACIPLDISALGTSVEDLLRRQAALGLFGDPEMGDRNVSQRLTAFHMGDQPVMPLSQYGPGGEQITMYVRGVVDRGHVIILAGPDNARFAALPALPVMQEPEPAEETTEW
jgi:PAS domain-containing protein